MAEGVSLLHSGWTAYRASGAQAWVPYYIALLAGAHEIAGQIDEALAQLDDALRIVETTEERWFEAEIYRQKGRLLLRQGHTDAAEELYRTALGIAREQQAKLWELLPPRALPGFGAIRVVPPKPAISSRRSTAGLPKASTRPI